ncbi:MAG: AAA family ATPase [Deltaproteobacteria bacterium]|nr:AAA family ATPase [Deltaproteobacteria bacterium]
MTRELLETWKRGRAKLGGDGRITLSFGSTMPPLQKLRGAYHWIAEHAVVTRVLDLEIGEPEAMAGGVLSLGRAYSSFVLMPLMTLATNQRLLIVGAPGRGKTSIAILMGLLAGIPLDEVRRGVQRGHPQLTIPDLLGSPLPAQLVRAEDSADIRVVWRKWLTSRVKVVDEYNRIPTKTQSALLSLLAEGYAEQFEQVVQAGVSSWFLTANDDLGGGTYPVIEALKDRIDAVTRAAAYDARALEVLLERVATAERAQDFIPTDLVFLEGELEALSEEIRAIPVPAAVLGLLGFLGPELEFCRQASDRLESMTKDGLHLAGRRVADVCTEDCPLDKRRHLCAQTESGISTRSMQALILYSKALAAFLGHGEVTLASVLAVAPYVFHDKLVPNAGSAYFEDPARKSLLIDRLSWIREVMQLAADQYGRHRKLESMVSAARAPIEERLGGMGATELKRHMVELKRVIQRLLTQEELGAAVREDVLKLRSTYERGRARLEQLEPPRVSR